MADRALNFNRRDELIWPLWRPEDMENDVAHGAK